VDGTCGGGGHSRAVGLRLSASGRMVCLDRDPQAVARCRGVMSFMGDRVLVLKANFTETGRVLEESGLGRADGILLDLGLSSRQLDGSGRGFSFKRDEPLDMRMDPETGLTAERLVNSLPQAELEKVLREYGEEKKARAVARTLVRAREKEAVTRSAGLASLIRSVLPPPRRPGEKDPATRSFQALRIAVNQELYHLRVFLNEVPGWITPGGRLVILAYHSLEDRMVKQALRAWEKGCTCPPDFPVCRCGKRPLFRPVRRRGLKPAKDETARNPRSRSAVLRSAERI
jgi:16S rRNA (cytosine1402-N4)-methyltransferase